MTQHVIWYNMKNGALRGPRLRVIRARVVKLLRYERERRRQGRDEFAERAGISPEWLRDIEEDPRRTPGKDAAARIRRALETCIIHEEFGISCSHRLPVPTDAELYAPVPDELLNKKKKARRPAVR